MPGPAVWSEYSMTILAASCLGLLKLSSAKLTYALMGDLFSWWHLCKDSLTGREEMKKQKKKKMLSYNPRWQHRLQLNVHCNGHKHKLGMHLSIVFHFLPSEKFTHFCGCRVSRAYLGNVTRGKVHGRQRLPVVRGRKKENRSSSDSLIIFFGIAFEPQCNTPR